MSMRGHFILLLGDFLAPSGGFTRADGRVRDRAQPGARAHPREDSCSRGFITWARPRIRRTERGFSRHRHVIHILIRTSRNLRGIPHDLPTIVRTQIVRPKVPSWEGWKDRRPSWMLKRRIVASREVISARSDRIRHFF